LVFGQRTIWIFSSKQIHLVFLSKETLLGLLFAMDMTTKKGLKDPQQA